MTLSRAAFLLVASLSLFPRMAQAQEGSPLKGIQDWFQNLGKPGLPLPLPLPPTPAPPPEEPAADTFTLNPLALQYSRLGVEYERALGTGFSFALAPEFAYRASDLSWHLTVGGTLGLRFFVLGRAPSGLFFGPEVSILYGRDVQADGVSKSLGLGLGGTVGWTIIFFNRFTLSVGFSAQYRSIPDPTSSEPNAYRSELIPLPRLAFGVAF